MLITPIVEGNKVNDPSDSSASATINLPSPNFAFAPRLFIIPPLITVGSIPAFSRIHAINDVVVVFPCEPATVIDDLSLITSASIIALEKVGIFFFFAAFSSTLFFLIADE